MAKVVTNPVKVIRAKCLDCCCGSFTEVEQCTAERCALHPFRFGKNPYRKRKEYTEEQAKELRDRMRVIKTDPCTIADESD